MSLNTLISGADCGPVNPLAQMVKHGEADRSIQRDRAGPSSSGYQLRQLPSTTTAGPNAADAAFARQFFDGPSSSAGPAPLQHAAPFQLPRGVSQAQSPGIHAPPQPLSPQYHDPQSLTDAWSRLSIHDTQPTAPLLATAWNRSSSLPQGTPQLDEGRAVVHSPHFMGGAYMPMGMQGGYMPMSTFQPPMMAPLSSSFSTAPQIVAQANWDQEFSKIAEEDVKGKGKEQAEGGDSESKEQTATEGGDYMSDFEKVWSQMSVQPDDLDELKKWEMEYQQVLQSQREAGEELGLGDIEHDFGDDLKRAWESKFGSGLNADFNMGPQSELDTDNDPSIPRLPPYQFEPNNPHLAIPADSLLSRAKEYIANNGSLSEASLLLEAAIQKGELGEGGFEAWILLGETRSMDEREDIGLLALREGVRRAREAGVLGPGMLSLAVSYTNESYDIAAHKVLRDWLRARYPAANVPVLGPDQRAPWHSHDVTVNAFLEVARDLHVQGKTDSDVQIGLGILHYADTDYDKAKDCFESALWERPGDYLLWNRLGSCLSNGLKPEEALGVYREALRLRPTYTRAIYNVGVACLNIGAHKEAAEHFLSALSIQKTAAGTTPPPDVSMGRSEQLWKTLRKAILGMEREDLVPLVDQGNVEVFRSHGFEF